jgi:hypothetical protein
MPFLTSRTPIAATLGNSKCGGVGGSLLLHHDAINTFHNREVTLIALRECIL